MAENLIIKSEIKDIVKLYHSDFSVLITMVIVDTDSKQKQHLQYKVSIGKLAKYYNSKSNLVYTFFYFTRINNSEIICFLL